MTPKSANIPVTTPKAAIVKPPAKVPVIIPPVGEVPVVTVVPGLKPRAVARAERFMFPGRIVLAAICEPVIEPGGIAPEITGIQLESIEVLEPSEYTIYCCWLGFHA